VRACASCGRTLGKVAARCLYCGTPSGAPPATSHHKPQLVPCPGCLRNVRVTPGITGTCTYCALGIDADDGGTVSPARAAGPAVTRAQIEHLVADLPPARLWDLVRDILHRRAAFHELGAGEAERAIDALTLIATWPADSAYWLPLSLADAPSVIARAVFGVSDGAVLYESGDPTLLVVIGIRDRAGDTSGRAAVNLLGVASQLAIGVGFYARDTDRVETSTRIQIRATLVERDGGVELTRRRNQIDQDAPTPLTAAQELELRLRIAASRALLAGYYIAGALFGPSCRGGTPFSLTREAIGQRLARLGCDDAPEIVDPLAIRMPPPFGA
jgi:hypothetical protein